MKRRTAIKAIGLSVGSFVGLPAWASGWNAAALGPLSFGTSANEALLAELVATIVPTTQTLGAKDLGVHLFIQKMLTTCFDQKAQDNFGQNMAAIDPLSLKMFGKPFVEAAAEQRTTLLLFLAKSTDKATQDFYKTLRGLTLQGYTTSEYYMTRFTDYEMAPARFYGCVPVKK